MDLKLDGKVVVICGGATGIGRACADAFADERARLAIFGWNEQALDELRGRGAEVFTETVDVSHGESVEAAHLHVIEALGGIDVGFNIGLRNGNSALAASPSFRPSPQGSAAMASPTKRHQTSNQAPNSKANAAYAKIREQIIEGAYAPGTRLVLDRLARELDMSTLPVREAIRRLEAEGYVQFRQNVGATVSALDAESFVQALETFAVIESAATAQAAGHLSSDDVSAAKALNEGMVQALDSLDRPRYAALHDEFHALLTSRCPNSHLSSVVSNERARLRRVRVATLALGAGGRREVEEHDQLLRLIESSAPNDAIEDLCRSHIAAVTSALAR